MCETLKFENITQTCSSAVQLRANILPTTHAILSGILDLVPKLDEINGNNRK